MPLLFTSFMGGQGEPGVVGAFVPTDLGTSILKAWYDFSDTSSITHSSGAVSQVDDKSGNGNHISQSTAASKPTTGVNTLNAMNVLDFDGGDELTRAASLALPTSQTGATMLVLRLITSGTSAGLAWISQNSGSFGDNCVLARDAGNMGAWGNGTSSSATPASAATYADSDNTNWHLSAGIYTPSSRTVYEDGTLKNTNATAVVTAAVTGLLVGHTLSRDRANNRFLTGRMAQVLILDGVGDTNRQKIEGWAMWKYNLQSQLPVGHPYKNAAP